MAVVVCVRVSEYVSVFRGMFNSLVDNASVRSFLNEISGGECVFTTILRDFIWFNFENISISREPVRLWRIERMNVQPVGTSQRLSHVQRSAMGSDLIKCHIVTLNQQSSDLFVSVGDLDAWCRCVSVCVCVCRMAVWRRKWHWSFVAIFVDYNWICSCTRTSHTHTPHTSQRTNAIHYNCCLV